MLPSAYIEQAVYTEVCRMRCTPGPSGAVFIAWTKVKSYSPTSGTKAQHLEATQKFHVQYVYLDI